MGLELKREYLCLPFTSPKELAKTLGGSSSLSERLMSDRLDYSSMMGQKN